jgi:hypothetical protein
VRMMSLNPFSLVGAYGRQMNGVYTRCEHSMKEMRTVAAAVAEIEGREIEGKLRDVANNWTICGAPHRRPHMSRPQRDRAAVRTSARPAWYRARRRASRRD